MNKEWMTHFSSILTRRLGQVMPGIRVIKETLKENSTGGPMDEIDLSANRYALELMMQIQNRTHQQAQEIAAALRRIDRGDFGTCRICGEDIALARLLAQPTTMVCIDCKRELEAIDRLKVA